MAYGKWMSGSEQVNPTALLTQQLYTPTSVMLSTRYRVQDSPLQASRGRYQASPTQHPPAGTAPLQGVPCQNPKAVQQQLPQKLLLWLLQKLL